ncbi:MAG: response regulator transcription factor [Phycisphaerales bacterium]|nr:response regulator transcription factor [Phycisphaerales bacterium]
MGNSLRILIVDDHGLVRTALNDRLAREPGIEIVGVAATGPEAMVLAQKHRPDIALLDIDLGGVESLSIAHWMLAGAPRTRVIFVSAHLYDRYLDFALDAGVQGFVSKNEPVSTLIAAIHAVARDATYFSPQVRERLMPPTPGDNANLRTRSAALTPRQREILGQIAMGRAKTDIAYRLGISVKTIETHCEMIMDKLHVHDRVELARLAIREGIIAA